MVEKQFQTNMFSFFYESLFQNCLKRFNRNRELNPNGLCSYRESISANIKQEQKVVWKQMI